MKTGKKVVDIIKYKCGNQFYYLNLEFIQQSTNFECDKLKSIIRRSVNGKNIIHPYRIRIIKK